MCPHTQNLPARCAKPIVRIGVSSHVRLDLRTPEIRVLLRPGRMGWAAMPKTPVNEDCDARRSEDEIRNSTRLDEDWDVDPIPQSTCVQLTA